MIQLVFDAATRARRSTRSRSRSATARTRAPSAPTGATTSSSSSTARTRSSIPAAGLAREQVHGGALPRQLGGGRRRLRRHARPARRAPPGRQDDPERPGRGTASVPVDRLRGPLGRAPAGVLQRADGPEPEDAVDASRSRGRRAGARAATRSRPAACSGPARPTSSAPRSRRARKALVQLLRNPARRCSSSRRCSPSSSSRDAHDLAPVAPLRLARRRSWGQILAAAGPDVRQAGAALPRDRPLVHPARLRHLPRAGARPRRLRLLGVDTTGESAGALALLVAHGRHDARAARARPRPGRDRVRARARSTRDGRRSDPRLPARARRGAVRCSAASRSPSPSGSRLTATAVLIPVAIWLAVRWALLAQAVELERSLGGRGRPSPQRRARARPLAPRGVARRGRRGARARRRPAPRRAADLRHGRCRSRCSTSSRASSTRSRCRSSPSRRRTSTSTRGCARSSGPSRCQRSSPQRSSSRPERCAPRRPLTSLFAATTLLLAFARPVLRTGAVRDRRAQGEPRRRARVRAGDTGGVGRR